MPLWDFVEEVGLHDLIELVNVNTWAYSHNTEASIIRHFAMCMNLGELNFLYLSIPRAILRFSLVE